MSYWLVGLLTVVLCGCSGPAAPEPDACAILACSKFRAFEREVPMLNTTEMRARLREVSDSAGCATTPGLSDGARAMLARFAVSAEYAAATERFGDLCNRVEEQP